MMLPLFKTSKGRRVSYWFVGPVNCSHCQKEIINDPFILSAAWNNYIPIINYYCPEHINKRPRGIVEYNLLCSSVLFKPLRAVQIFLTPPSLANSRDCLIFDLKKLQSDITRDKTVFSDRYSLEGSSVGVPLLDDSYKDKFMSDVDEFQHSLDLIKSESVIPFVDTFMLEESGF